MELNRRNIIKGILSAMTVPLVSLDMPLYGAADIDASEVDCLTKDEMEFRERMLEAIKERFPIRKMRKDLPRCRCGRPAVVMKTREGLVSVACAAIVDQDLDVLRDAKLHAVFGLRPMLHSQTCCFNTEDSAVNNWIKYLGAL